MVAQAPVQGVIAAGLGDPRLIKAWREDPELLSSLGIQPDEMDLESIWKFVGLNTKVRYNPVRSLIPLTFQVMSAATIEIDIFSSFAIDAAQLRKSGRNSPEDKCEALVAFFEEWLDEDRADHMAVWDSVQHEMTMRELREEPIADTTHTPQPVQDAHQPVIRGNLRLLQPTYDIGEIRALLVRRPSDFSRLEQRDLQLGYWRPSLDADIQILNLPEVGLYVLSMIDGQTSVAQIGDRIGWNQQGLPWSDFIAIIQGYVDIGLISVN